MLKIDSDVHVAIVSKQGEVLCLHFKVPKSVVSIFEEKGMAAARQGIDIFLKHYSKTIMDFRGSS